MNAGREVPAEPKMYDDPPNYVLWLETELWLHDIQEVCKYFGQEVVLCQELCTSDETTLLYYRPALVEKGRIRGEDVKPL